MKCAICSLVLVVLVSANALAGVPISVPKSPGLIKGDVTWFLNLPKDDQDTEAVVSGDFILSFSAGATYLNPYRPSDEAKGHQIYPTLAFNWAPVWVSEIGAAVDLGQKNSFILRPNVKIFLARNPALSVYLEGAAALFSHPSGFALGGGASLGVIIGLMEHLGLELRAGGLAASMSPEAAAHFVESGNLVPRSAVPRESATVLFPSVGAALVARF